MTTARDTTTQPVHLNQIECLYLSSILRRHMEDVRTRPDLKPETSAELIALDQDLMSRMRTELEPTPDNGDLRISSADLSVLVRFARRGAQGDLQTAILDQTMKSVANT